MTPGRLLAVVCALALTGIRHAAAQPSCPGTSALTVYVENRSAEPTVTISVEGQLAPDASACDGAGAGIYSRTLDCTGSGRVRCGVIEGLNPGRWVHRITVTVPESDVQRQAQEGILLSGAPREVSNVVEWTIFPRTFVVAGTAASDFHAALDAAETFTNGGTTSALVTFDPTAFPGASAPGTILLMQGPSCTVDPSRNHCPDGFTAGRCLVGSGIVIDGLDHDAKPGGVVLSVDTCGLRLLRIYGADDVIRGLTLTGSRKSNPTGQCQADTLGIVGANARRDRIEAVTIRGPTCGDALSADSASGQPDADGPGDNLVVGSRITGAADKGAKIDFGAAVRIERSCIHDNRNGGIQSTLGGHVIARENIVQRNIPGAAQNGLSVAGRPVPGGPNQGVDERSTLVTSGNIIRFSGGRGLSVTDNASGDFHDDYVADNQFSGSRIETTSDGAPDKIPSARFSGVALVCNRRGGLTGKCAPAVGDERPCGVVEDCCTAADGTVDPTCVAQSACNPGSASKGIGLSIGQFQNHPLPDVQLGTDAAPGMNALTANLNLSGGGNLRVDAPVASVPAVGNQWEHCGSGANCDLAAVATNDVAPVGAPVLFGATPGPRAGAPLLDTIHPGRPRTGDVVRIFGTGFDAIGGNPAAGATCSPFPTCAPDGSCPSGPCVDGSCPCSPDNPVVRGRNASEQTGGTRIQLLSATDELLATVYPDAVTPTMLAFRMPFDCVAPIRAEVARLDAKNNLVAADTTLCDPSGCVDREPGAPCDDGNACTLDDQCTSDGACVGAVPLDCAGPCEQCDPDLGCVPRPAGSECRPAAGPCDAAEICDGNSSLCPADALLPATTVCRAASSTCDVAEHCTGTSAACPDDAFAPATTVCRPSIGICDVAESCTGTSATCPTDSFALPTTPCRASAGDCDVTENCTGSSNTCPADVRVSAGTTCREAVDPCDVSEACDGTLAQCPADAVRTGLDGVRCAFKRDFSPPVCLGELLPPFVAKRLMQAGAAVDRAGVHAPGRWLGVADRSLGRALRRLDHRPQTPCSAARRALLTDARTRVEAERIGR